MNDHPSIITVAEIVGGGPGELRHAGGGEYELYDAAGTRVARCEPGDTVYVDPYLYVCQGGRWVRLPNPHD